MLVIWILGFSLIFKNANARINVQIRTILVTTLNSWDLTFINLVTIPYRAIFFGSLLGAIWAITIIRFN